MSEFMVIPPALARRLDRARELVYCGGVEAAPVIAREHVEVLARDPVARALRAVRILFLEQQDGDGFCGEVRGRPGRRDAIRRPGIKRSSPTDPAVETAAQRREAVLRNRSGQEHGLAALPV